MAGSTGEAVRRIGDLLDGGAVGGLSNAELLERAAGGTEVAFEAIVARHGPTVLGVCRRVLRDEHEAEDAFQVTFLVLARKAATLRSPERLGPWLYGVALRTSLASRALADRRRRQADRLARTTRPPAEPADDDLAAVLDAEVGRLPEKYRTPLILCDLEGRPRPDVARDLGLAEGTLSSRLSRGRSLLRSRLARRGYAPGVAGLAAATARESTAAIVSAALAARAARLAAAFASKGGTGVVPAALILLLDQTWRTTAMTFRTWATVGLVGLGLAVPAARSWQAPSPTPTPTPAPARSSSSVPPADPSTPAIAPPRVPEPTLSRPGPTPPSPKQTTTELDILPPSPAAATPALSSPNFERDRLDGTWVPISLEVDGEKRPEGIDRPFVVHDGRWATRVAGKDYGGKIEIDASADPKRILLSSGKGPQREVTPDSVQAGIVAVDGGTMILCLATGRTSIPFPGPGVSRDGGPSLPPPASPFDGAPPRLLEPVGQPRTSPPPAPSPVVPRASSMIETRPVVGASPARLASRRQYFAPPLPGQVRVSDDDAPAEFATQPGSSRVLILFKRITP